jgi:pimeloyl-ACP methyl ester carboxylesterase
MEATESKGKLSAYRLQDHELEKALLSGEHAEILEQYLGESEYDELRQLALDAYKKDVRGGPRVLILPGIMGSKLGHHGKIFDDTLWIDPFEIVLGHLDELALGDKTDRFEALGVILFAYLKLKLYLKIKGYDADFHPFDWRKDIGVLGKQLAERLKSEGNRKVSLVAHSMGGLVARGAMGKGGDNVERLVMLGTPNHGSFVPVQALRGIYSIVRKLAALDLRHGAEELAEKVFSTFPGLYQMLPWFDKFSELDLYDVKNWPPDGPQPRTNLLKKAPETQQSLSKADHRFFLIAGVNQETITGIRLEDNAFIYEQSYNGDGTVPLDFALLAGATTYYVEESHGSLPNNGKVEHAVADILARGSTQVLPDHWEPSRKEVIRMLHEEDLRVPAFDGRTSDAIRPSEIRRLIAEVAAPDMRETAEATETIPGTLPSTGLGYAHEFSRVVVGRRRQYRIDIRLALGSITEVDSAAYVLGMFRNVEPSGPASALNERLGGLITEFTSRRMITGNLGEVFLMPVGRYNVQADMILIAGLGSFDRLSDEALQLCAENTIRTFVRSKIDEFATVLLGAGSGLGVQRSLANLVTGFFRGLQDADVDRRFRRITICEYDRTRFEDIKRELYRLASTSLFDDVETTIDEKILPAPIVPVPGARRVPVGPDPVYLIVRRENESGQIVGFRSSILTSGEKATVITGVKEVTKKNLDSHLNKVKGRQFTFNRLDDFGERLAELVLTPEIMAVLPGMKDRPMVVVHDAPGSRIPWETIRIDGWSPAISGGLSRRYAADNLSVAKWLEKRRYGKTLDLLLVVNPTGDLDGAEKEGTCIHGLFDSHSLVNITELRGAEASKQTLKRAFQSGKYDVVHYAGHAYFDEQEPSRSGILCHGRDVLTGAELAGLGNLPGMVFFNACEAGRVRGRGKKPDIDIKKRIQENVGLAEAFLRGGVANYVGTYWSVGDASAKRFAETFYPALLDGKSISSALLSARKSVHEIRSVDWADYIHYGSPNFIMKYSQIDILRRT